MQTHNLPLQQGANIGVGELILVDNQYYTNCMLLPLKVQTEKKPCLVQLLEFIFCDLLS